MTKIRMRYASAIFCCLLIVSSYSVLNARPQGAAALPAVEAPAPAGTGPYRAIFEADPGLPTHTVYRPANLDSVPKKEKLPIVAWANGGCANSSRGHMAFLTEVASHGFLVVAIGPAGSLQAPPPTAEGRGAGGGGNRGGGGRGPSTSSSQLIDAINWATAENSRDGSKYKGKLDTSKIAVMGQSCGGLQTLDVSSDPRVSTSVVISGGIPIAVPGQAAPGVSAGAPAITKDALAKLHAPIAYIFGGPMDIAYGSCMDDVARIQNLPVFSGSLTAALHGGTFAEPNGGEYGVVVSKWLEWQLKGDKDAKKMFVGQSCELCTNASWKVAQKNLK